MLYNEFMRIKNLIFATVLTLGVLSVKRGICAVSLCHPNSIRMSPHKVNCTTTSQ